MITQQQKKLAQWAIEYALKNGSQAARISLYSNSTTSFEVRNMKLDSLQQATESGLSIQLYVDGRFGSISTNRLDKQELEKFIRNGIDSARYLATDLARVLPDEALYYKGGSPDLQLYDPKFAALNPDDKLALAMKACGEIADQDPRVVSASGSYSDSDSFSYRIASNGFEGEAASSHFTVSAEASLKDPESDARPGDYWYESSLYFDELVKENVGRRALQRAVSKLGQKKTASAKMPMVVDAMNARNLLSPVINAIFGSAIQQKNSFMLDKLGQKLFSPAMTLLDEPHLVRSSGARYFDNEGVATHQLTVFDKGVPNLYYIDVYNANKLAVPPTISSPSILVMQLGDKTAEALAASLNKGIFVTGFNGGNCNPATGDFSYGVEGFLVENGKITQPINEMNITGNMLVLWNNLVETGSDARLSSSWRIPSLLFDNVDFSGA